MWEVDHWIIGLNGDVDEVEYLLLRRGIILLIPAVVLCVRAIYAPFVSTTPTIYAC